MKNQSVNILTGGGGPAEPTAERHPQCDPCENLTIAIKQSELAYNVKSNAKGEVPAGFTMAEILLSLTIIGVVAAITLPSLTGNINERTWNTQRKALYARFSQAIALMPSLNGYGTLTEEDNGSGSKSIEDNAAETFVTDGLAKVLKINNICDSEHLEDCGIVSAITTFKGSKIDVPTTLLGLNSTFNMTYTNSDGYVHSYSVIDSKAAAFETQNGESILVYYNPKCTTSIDKSAEQNGRWHYLQQIMCTNFVYDLNGNKGPNTVGKDIGFMTAMYPSDAVLASVMPVAKTAEIPFSEIGKSCSNINTDTRAPNYDEGAVLFYNKNLIGDMPHHIWTSTTASSDKAWWVSTNVGYRERRGKDKNATTYCIRRN